MRDCFTWSGRLEVRSALPPGPGDGKQEIGSDMGGGGGVRRRDAPLRRRRVEGEFKGWRSSRQIGAFCTLLATDDPWNGLFHVKHGWYQPQSGEVTGSERLR